MPLLLSNLLKSLEEYPSLAADLLIEDFSKFYDLVYLLKPYLHLLRSIYDKDPLPTLPYYILDLLKASLGLSIDSLKLLWDAMKSSIWEASWSTDTQTQLSKRYISYFLRHGMPRSLLFYSLLPPTRTCLDPLCTKLKQRRELVEAKSYPITVFSLDLGPVPGMVVSLYCRYCKTRYYPNYYVHDNASTRTYYPGLVPDFIHAKEHTFIDKQLCAMFTSMMLNLVTSAANCAKVYNETMSNTEAKDLLADVYRRDHELAGKTVWDSLFLFWLMEDHVENNTILEVNHQASTQAIHLEKALEARNDRMIGPGQELWNHACDLCLWIKEQDGDEAIIRSVVVDANVRHIYCPKHFNLNKKCCAVACSDDAEPGFRTCTLSEHRQLETWLREENKAMFQLKRRLARTGGQLEIDETADAEMCSGKEETGNRAPHARFGRRLTHNEELCVTSCGIILERATFYGSEAPNGVRIFLMGLFPTKKSLPHVIWHDNNCKIRAMLQNDPEELRTYFDECAMPVDVFHFKSKHKKGDIECNKHCNPANWKDLMTEDGHWRFNSSAAEQTNVWFGHYLPVVRGMDAVQYDFFLDEMIKRRNRNRVVELERIEKSPYQIPRTLLLHD
ncbi:hypothetical protein CVT24_002284 [Panaeolus cyanescens]|uniref:CxC5 like cysteine cluster associated with KDZ domain-containing protein n=1 Tax=Panaeolus cyanescens TaxID=181874 RepID=A0A409WJK0_9AGAR|nr:hypothetical protein CVT24_002284 [Panaeolus cyanescens]